MGVGYTYSCSQNSVSLHLCPRCHRECQPKLLDDVKNTQIDDEKSKDDCKADTT